MTRTSGSEQKMGVFGAGTRIVALGATTLAMAVVAAGCGGSGEGSADAAGGSADPREQFREAALKHARCMRDEGIDMPDPQFEGGGVVRLGPGTGVDPDAPGFAEADEKCRKHLEAVEPPEISEEQREEFQQAALDFARCMRDEGIDMPDPQFDGGRVTMRAGPGGGLDREDPAFQEAFETCQDELPEGRGGPGAPAPAP